MQVKLILQTISTGVLLGLISLVVWSFSIIQTGSKPTKSALPSAAPQIQSRKILSYAQTNFGQQVQAYILPITQSDYLPIRNFNIPEPVVSAKAAGVFDLASDKLLYSKNVYEKLPIASITKLMTASVIMENLPLNEKYTVAAEDLNADGNGADLIKGEQILGADLLKFMLIDSSNDAALVFAGNASKMGINLVAKMNEKAGSLNMTDTKFSDPAGLDDSDSYSTIADLTKLVQWVDKYPIIWEILTLKTADVSSIDGNIKHHLVATNKLLGEISGIVGGKTGFTEKAKETMVLEVKIDDIGHKVIVLVLGSDDRFGEIKKLIDWAKAAYSWN